MIFQWFPLVGRNGRVIGVEWKGENGGRRVNGQRDGERSDDVAD